MSCPKYKDHTRECIIEHKEIIEATNYDLCESDKYEECPVYKLISGKFKPCEFMEECKNNSKYENVDFIKLTKLTENYCFTEKKVNCARYKLLKEGKKVPGHLLADGSMAPIEIKK